MALNRLGEETLIDNRPPVPVTVPELSFLKKGPPLDNEPERREIAARFAEHRIVAKGRDAWAAIDKAEILRRLEGHRRSLGSGQG